MHHTIQHRSAIELEQGLADVTESPRDAGRLEAIVIRPASNERRMLQSVRLTPEGGVEGDRWVTDSYYRLKDGRSDPCCQVSIMNARFLRQIAGSEDSICLAGDNLIVDLDLSEANLPAGSRLAIGREVVIEITEKAHTGCSKLEGRYGSEARAFMNSKARKSLHLRGRYASVVSGGTIAVGDVVRKQ
ncbi:MAG TPA: MOSC domain-containing protein [Lacipirellulaceae bacterium]|nr:MOSC domain-containing protein [Lacipirellulaceae bacterium]